MEASADWALRNLSTIRSSIRKMFGLILGLDGAFKFLPHTPFWFSERVLAASIGQPPWLKWWFDFWVQQSNANAAADVFLTAGLEFALAFALIAGVLRKTAYMGGISLSLMIWAVPEGFGGPYEPGTFDIGTGIIYAMAFLMLLALEVDQGANFGTLDAWIERRIPTWSRWAEVVKQGPTTSSGNPNRT